MIRLYFTVLLFTTRKYLIFGYHVCVVDFISTTLLNLSLNLKKKSNSDINIHVQEEVCT